MYTCVYGAYSVRYSNVHTNGQKWDSRAFVAFGCPKFRWRSFKKHQNLTLVLHSYSFVGYFALKKVICIDLVEFSCYKWENNEIV